MALHTLLGANGTIATELVPILQANNEKIRLVSRNPKPVAGAETRAADVLNRQQVIDALPVQISFTCSSVSGTITKSGKPTGP